MKKGTRKRALGDLRKDVTALAMEREALDGARGKVRHCRAAFKTDVLEVCAGCAVITRRVAHFGLRAGQPIDILYGWDLLAPGGGTAFLNYVDQARPELLACEPPWTDWCSFTLINFKDDPEELERRRDIQRRLMKILAKA